jgi:zinc protease
VIRLLFLVALLLGSLPAGGQTPRVIAGKTGSNVPYLRVPMPNATTQSLQLLWKDVSPQVSSKPGLPLAAAFLMAREPKGEKLGELTETLRDYQAGFNVSVSTNASGLSIAVASEHFAPAMAIIQRFIHTPALPQDRLDTYARDVELRGRQALRQGDVLASHLRVRAMLPDGPLRRYHLTDPKKLDGVTAADVEAWRQTLARDRLLVVTAGPLPPEALDGPINALIAGLPETAPKVEAAQVALRALDRTIVLERNVPQTIIQAIGPTGIEAGFDAIKASMAVARLGGGSQGRLHAALRDALGATYGAAVSLDSITWSATGVSLRTAVSHDKAAEAIKALRAEYARWWEGGVTEAEFAATRSAMIGNRRANRLQPGGVAITLINGIARGGPEDYFAAYDRAVEAVTREEVNAYIKARFPKELGFIVIAPGAAGLGADCVLQRLEDAPTCGL